jgi:RNA recognition motif-containing protein
MEAEWAQLRQAREELERERKEFEAEREASGIEFKLFIGNLNPTTTQEDLQKNFSPYGKIKEIVLLKDKDGKSKRSAFVKYYTKANAEKAVAEVHDRLHDKGVDIPMVVRFASQKEKTGLRAGAASAFQSAYSPQNLAAAAASASGFGFGVSPASAYGSLYSAPAALSLGGVSPVAAVAPVAASAQGSTRRGPQGSNLYVNNLDRFITEDDVRAMFSDFGNVISVKLFTGYGFVSYDNAQSAQAAIAALNGMMSSDGQRRLEVSLKKDKAGGSVGGAAPARFTPY